MKNLTFLFGVLFGLAASLLFPAATASPPPPVQTTIAISLTADREFLLDHEEVAERLHYLARLKAGHQANADSAEAAALLVAARVRRGLVRYKAALDSTLPAVLTDLTYRRTDSDADGKITKADDIDALLVNADATGQ